MAEQVKLWQTLDADEWAPFVRGTRAYNVTEEGFVYVREPQSGEGAVGLSIRLALEKLKARLSE